MRNKVRRSRERRKDFIDPIYEEITDMFVCQEADNRELSVEELEDIGMIIIEP